MADRYQNIRELKNDQGRRYYATTIYPEIPLSENDIYVITGEGDRLDLLADQYYNDSTLWWIISSANRGLSQNSLYIPIGTQLRIPVNTNSILSNFISINSL